MDGSSSTRSMHAVGALGIVLGITFCFFLLAVYLPSQTSRLFHGVERVFSIAARRKTLVIVVLFLGVIGIRLAFLLLIPVPGALYQDEFSYLLLGDTLAHGRLTNPTHPMWVSFETFHVLWHPTYCSKYYPGQGFCLALGQWLGNPWFGVVLSVAAMCAAVLWMLQGWLPSRWALLGAALVALKFGISSYWMNSYWGGAAAATGGALVLGAMPRLVQRGRVRDALILGLGAAILGNTRPYEGLIFCIPVACWFLWWLAGKTKSHVSLRNRMVKAFVPIAAISAVTLTFIAYYNWRLTGNAFLTPHDLHDQTYKSMGNFLWQHPRPPLHYNNRQFEDLYSKWEHQYYDNSWRGIWRVSRLKLLDNRTTYFWLGCLLLLPVIPWVLLDRKMRLPLVVLSLGIVGFLLSIWGWAHYIAPLTCVIFLLLVQAIRHLRTLRPYGRPVGAALSWAVVFLLARDIGSYALQHKCGPELRNCEGLPGRAAVAQKLAQTPGRHLLMVRYGDHHNPHLEWIYNGAEIETAKVLWARELDSDQNAKLFDYFKDRKIWLIEPDVDNTKIIPYPLL